MLSRSAQIFSACSDGTLSNAESSRRRKWPKRTGSRPLSSKPLTRFPEICGHELSWIPDQPTIFALNFLRRPPAGRDVLLVLAALGALLQSDLGEILRSGSALTLSYAQHARKPVLHRHNSETCRDPLPRRIRQLKEFIESDAIQVLNVAGPRESNESGNLFGPFSRLRGVLSCQLELHLQWPSGTARPRSESA
jgi:hypothetical protein